MTEIDNKDNAYIKAGDEYLSGLVNIRELINSVIYIYWLY